MINQLLRANLQFCKSEEKKHQLCFSYSGKFLLSFQQERNDLNFSREPSLLFFLTPGLVIIIMIIYISHTPLEAMSSRPPPDLYCKFQTNTSSITLNIFSAFISHVIKTKNRNGSIN